MYISNLFGSTPIPSAEVWSIGSKNYVFTIVDSKTPLVSKLCENPKKRCEALRAIDGKLKIKFTERELRGGKNPGSVACQKIYQGEVLILRNSAGAENSFCKFKDHSLASTSELY